MTSQLLSLKNSQVYILGNYQPKYLQESLRANFKLYITIPEDSKGLEKRQKNLEFFSAIIKSAEKSKNFHDLLKEIEDQEDNLKRDLIIPKDNDSEATLSPTSQSESESYEGPVKVIKQGSDSDYDYEDAIDEDHDQKEESNEEDNTIQQISGEESSEKSESEEEEEGDEKEDKQNESDKREDEQNESDEKDNAIQQTSNEETSKITDTEENDNVISNLISTFASPINKYDNLIVDSLKDAIDNETSVTIKEKNKKTKIEEEKIVILKSFELEPSFYGCSKAIILKAILKLPIKTTMNEEDKSTLKDWFYVTAFTLINKEQIQYYTKLINNMARLKKLITKMKKSELLKNEFSFSGVRGFQGGFKFEPSVYLEKFSELIDYMSLINNYEDDITNLNNYENVSTTLKNEFSIKFGGNAIRNQKDFSITAVILVFIELYRIYCGIDKYDSFIDNNFVSHIDSFINLKF